MPTRLIREGWLESETVNHLNAEEERFYLRLMLRADDFGRYHANPVLLRSALYPLKDDVRTTDVSRWLAACEKAGLVRCYTHAQKLYLEIPKFGQRTRADSSKFPEPPAQADTGLLAGLSLTDAARRPASAGHMTDKRQAIARLPRTDSETKAKANLSPPGKPGGKSATPTGGNSNRRLFEALARAEGSDPDQLTGSHGGRIGKALKEILGVCPTLAVEDVDRAAAQYRKVMPKGAKLTASALASNWGKCSPALVMPQREVLEPEPTGWRQIFPEFIHVDKPWPQIPADNRAHIVAQMAKRKPTAA